MSERSLQECHEIIMRAIGKTNVPPPAKNRKSDPIALETIHQDWLDACQQTRKILTRWEANFLVICADWLDRGQALTPSMAENLERIYTEKV